MFKLGFFFNKMISLTFNDNNVSFFFFSYQESIPFAVVGSNLVYEMNGRKVRGRTYPWGVVDSMYTNWTIFFFVKK